MFFLTTSSRMALRGARAAAPAVRISSARLPIGAPATASFFHTSPLRAALSESDLDPDVPDAGAQAEKSKDESLQAQKDGKGHHKHELASDSESAVKSDKEDKSIEQMQKEGEEKGKK